jgi:hypothetical protein
MEPNNPPKDAPQISEQQLRALFELSGRLQELQAEIEFVKLMITLRLPRA